MKFFSSTEITCRKRRDGGYINHFVRVNLVFVTLEEILSLSKLYDLVSFVMWFFYHNSNSYMIVVSDSSFYPNWFLFFPIRLLPPFPRNPLIRGGGTVKNT